MTTQTKTVYKFNEQLLTGKAGEWVMRKYHEPFYRIRKVGMREERQGYDFIFTSKARVWKVEIKTDFLTHETGNIIIETKSSEKPYKPGWAIKSQADVLIYYIWGSGEVLYFWMNDIRARVEWWQSYYGETARARNKTYNSVSVLLPLREARGNAFTIRNGVDPYWMKEHYIQWQQMNQTAI